MPEQMRQGVQGQPPPSEADAPQSDRQVQLKAKLQGKSLAEQERMLAPPPPPGSGGSGEVHAAAKEGAATPGGSLPFQAQIQRAFGPHDVSGIRAHVGPEAGAAAEAMGAAAYATGDHVVFQGTPDLHTAAHEAAHVVQQRAGVGVAGGVGASGDGYERRADAVAERVVRGESASDLLGSPNGAASGADAPVQKKNLSQAKLDDGLSRGAKAPLMNQAFSGIVYGAKGVKAASRTEALKRAAMVSGTVGQRVKGMDWTWSARFLDKATAASIDPFHLQVTTPFTHSDGSDQTLEITYQHANTFMGYVTGIKDSSNPAASNATMYTPEDGPQGPTDKYSNIHDTKDQGNLAAMTQGGKEKNLDAYTKIAGEGARWRCVRNHADKLQNDTLFFTADPDHAGYVLGVTFRALWLSWRDAFSRDYNVSDARVAAAILTGGLTADARSRAKANLSAKDYDLDLGQGHTPTPPATPKKGGSDA